MLTAITRRLSRDERGFTLVELMVTMLVMGIVAGAVTSVAVNAFKTTSTITNRRDVFSDGRIALDRMSKQLRQGESIAQASSTASTVTFDTYIDGVAKTVVWRVNGSAAPFELLESRDGGSNFNTVVSSLGSNSVFTYTTHGGVLDQVTIALTLVTDTTEVELTTDVHLRNA